MRNKIIRNYLSGDESIHMKYVYDFWAWVKGNRLAI